VSKDKKESWVVREFEKASEAKGRGAWFLPFSIIIVCLYFISNVSVDDSVLELHSGKLVKYDFTRNYIEITIKKNNCEKISRFEFFEQDKKLLQLILPTAENIKIWTNKESSYVLQLSTDGKIIIEYGSWWRRTAFLWVGVLIGLLLIPLGLKGLEQDIKRAKEEKYRETEDEIEDEDRYWEVPDAVLDPDAEPR